MTTKLYPKWKEAVMSGGANSQLNGTVKVALVDAGVYTYSDTHEFYSSVSAGVVGTPVVLNNKTFTNGTFDADDSTFTAVVGASIEALVIYIDTGTPSTSRLVAYIDGTAEVEVAVDASNGATTIVTEDLPNDIIDNGVMTKVSGSGPASITVNGAHTAGARSLSVDALSGALTAGARYSYAIAGFGLPVTPNGGNITVAWDASGIFTL
jgi:hypothetical protein